MADAEQSGRKLPGTLDATRDRDLLGRTHHVWLRRGGLLLLLALIVAALFNVFGQDPSTASSSANGATLSISGPTRVRGGLIFQTRFQISSSQAVKDARIALSPGWFESMTLNSTSPQPSTETYGAGAVRFAFGSLRPGETKTIWLEWSVNPTNVATRHETATLYDGKTPLTTLHRTVTIFP